MKEYDYIIAGGGCAGLSLAARLNHTSLKNKKILILDTEPKSRNDKTWCFWSEGNENIFTRKQGWQKLQIHTSKGEYKQDISPLSYQFVSSGEFYKNIYEELQPNPNFEFKYERVLALQDQNDGALVLTNEGQYKAKWVFNSINFPIQKHNPRRIYLAQHFFGWFLEMEEDVFDPEEMKMMDFQVEQENETRFVYVLPFSKRKALIEFTVFSEQLWEKEAYSQALSAYIESNYPGISFRILQEEQGVIPMTNHKFQRNKGKHILNIGTAGGFTKSTTGYTFRRIQEDTQKITEALLNTGNPNYPLKKAKRFGLYDNLLLYIIQQKGGIVHRIFDKLFSQNDFRTILRFLDEKTSLREELWIMIRLPWKPFLHAIKDYYIMRKPIRSGSPIRRADKNTSKNESTVA